MSATTDPSLKSREEQDAELDRRIEALRKKNEALMKRHQEIEEDRKKAEEDGISVTTRRPKYEAENDRKQNGKGIATVTSDPVKPPAERHERRAPMDRRPRGGMESAGRRPWVVNADTAPHYTSPSNRPDRTPRAERTQWAPREFPEEPEGDRRGRGRRGRGGRGGGGGGGGGGIDGGIPAGVSPPDRRVKEWEEKRRQNIEKMNEEMEQIAEYERGQMDNFGEKNPMRNFLDDPRRLGSLPDGDRKEGSRRHVRNWDFEKVKAGVDWGKDRQVRRQDPKDSFDITLSMTGRERAEYTRWKKERDQIDQERLARHRNATGQWKREWDAEKTEPMFKESTRPTEECNVRGLKNSKKSYLSSRRTDEQKPSKPPTISDYIFQSKNKDTKRGGVKRRENYSMHDDRWETPEAEQEEEKEKESKPQPTQAPAPAPAESKANVDETPADNPDDADEDQWEDASDSEEEIVGEDVSASEEEEEELVETTEERKKDGGGTKEQVVVADVESTRRGPEVRHKEQRVRKSADRPRLHIPPTDVSREAADVETKPLSPFLLDGYQPVKDWAEEMEDMSPRTIVEQSPLQSAPTGPHAQDHGQPDVLLPVDCGSHASLVHTGQEPVATAEVNGSAGDVPAGEIAEETVEGATDEAATIEAGVMVEQGSRTEVDPQAG
ncbi:coiled-coil domain-containing protein 9-like isoform X2 [Rhinoraja longicauda]